MQKQSREYTTMVQLVYSLINRLFGDPSSKSEQDTDREDYMYVIAGLGNPGKKYENTRHNMGFLVVDVLADKFGINVNRIKHKALVGDGRIGGEKVLLVKPQTYMNLSGESLGEIVRYYNIPDENLIVVYDDMDIETGTLRIRKKGSAGGHNGMKSIVSHVGSDQFPRVRVGIGGSGDLDWKDFVLGKVKLGADDPISKCIDHAAEAIECMIVEGVDIAMNKHNTPKKKKPKKSKTEQTEELPQAEEKNIE